MAWNPFRRRPVVVVAPPPGGPPPVLAVHPRRPCVMGDCGDAEYAGLEAASTAAAIRRGLPERRDLPPALRPGIVEARGMPAGAHRVDHGRIDARVKALPPRELHQLAVRHEAKIDREHRDAQARMHKLSEAIERGRVPAAQRARAEAERRQLGAKTTALYLRRKRAQVSRILADLAGKAQGDEAEKLRRASVYVLRMPIHVSKGVARAGCAASGVSGLGDLGLPGGAYTGSEAVPQYDFWPAEWRDPSVGLRAGLLAATGMSDALAQRPSLVTLPPEVGMPQVPPSVVAVQPRLPGIRLRTQTLPPRGARMALPPPAPHCPRPAVMAAPPRRAHFVVLPPPARATTSAVTSSSAAALSGLGEDIILADFSGDYEETVLAADLGSLEGLEGLGFDGLAGLSDAEFGKLNIKWPWAGRLRAHKVKVGRLVAAGLLGGALASVGMPIAGGIAAGSIAAKAFDQVAQGTTDEEEEVAGELKLPVKAGWKARRLARLRAWFRQAAAKVRCG